MKKLSEKLLKRPIPDPLYASAPVYDNFIFLDEEKKKEWDEMPESQKSFVMNHLHECCSQMQSNMAIEMLCHVINDLMERIKKLEINLSEGNKNGTNTSF